MFDKANVKVAVIGLGYVGLPLAVAFARHYSVLGFDINQGRVAELMAGKDSTLEVSGNELERAENLSFTSSEGDLRDCNFFIVTVPTPIDKYNRPDFTPLHSATATLGRNIKQGDVVVYESTVYPGATEEECVPILEAKSGLIFGKDFYVGYSPERINPGDKEHRIEDIVKVTSGCDLQTANFIDDIYASVISAGTFKASSIKVAEAAKVIENTQRDVNIALINELAMIFDALQIDTGEVLEAASTKWNFLPFRPGLVGGHCIGVDPYYLTHKAQSVGYHPELVLAGRRINDGMSTHIVSVLVKQFAKRSISLTSARVAVLGLTFKENCPDIRNTKVIDIVNELQEYSIAVDVMDPWCDPQKAKDEFGLEVRSVLDDGGYDGVILAVAHNEFKTMGIEKIRALGKPTHLVYDLKHIFPPDDVDVRL